MISAYFFRFGTPLPDFSPEFIDGKVINIFFTPKGNKINFRLHTETSMPLLCTFVDLKLKFLFIFAAYISCMAT